MRALIGRVAAISLLVCLITATTAALNGLPAAMAVGSLWVLAVCAGALRWVALERREVTTPPQRPPWGFDLSRLPADRYDEALVHAAITGRPLKRPLTIHERYRAAVVCAWQGKDVGHIARILGCSEQEVELLLAIRPPLSKAASSR